MNPLWTRTPLLHSLPLSRRLGCRVFLKLENLQPSGSFKYRGLSALLQQSLPTDTTLADSVHFVIASGGNAGLAVAHISQTLNAQCTIFLPEAARSLTPTFELLGAGVVVGGANYFEAQGAANEFVRMHEEAVLVPPYDNPTLWKNNGSMIEEIAEQLPPGTRPDAILCSVGGGSLIGGIMNGCRTVGWTDVPLAAMETHGSNCFYHSLLANRSSTSSSSSSSPHLHPHSVQDNITHLQDPDYKVKLARLPGIKSRAASLGATSPAAGVVRLASDRPKPVVNVSVPDELAMQAALGFAGDHQMLAELGCSTTLVPAYFPILFERIFPAFSPNADRKEKVVVFIVCGGVKTSVEEVEGYKKHLADGPRSWDVWIDGDEIKIDLGRDAQTENVI